MPPTKPLEKIVSYYIDPENNNNTYVATSLGRLFLWDWVDGKLVYEWNIGLVSLDFISVCANEKLESAEFVGTVYAAECMQKSGTLWKIRLPKNPEAAVEKISVFETPVDRICSAQVLDGGNIIVVTTGRTLAIGNKQEGKSNWGLFRKYPMTFYLTCMDAFLPEIGTNEGKGKKGKKTKAKGGGDDLLGDVVVGDETGAIHVFHNVLRSSNTEPVIRKLHWHRKKVQSAKWALDGTFHLALLESPKLIIYRQLHYLRWLGDSSSTLANRNRAQTVPSASGLHYLFSCCLPSCHFLRHPSLRQQRHDPHYHRAQT